MSRPPISRIAKELLSERAELGDFFRSSTWTKKAGQPGISDFVVGNPQDGPLPGFEEALMKASRAKSTNWFAYKLSEPGACALVARSLGDRYGIAFDPADICMTNGAFAGLGISLRTVVDPGDEVIFVSPPWFSYEGIVRSIGATPVKIKVSPPDFELRASDIANAITDKTRAVILNSPHNPTGRIYSRRLLEEIGVLLSSASRDRAIYLVSDEAYSRIVYDDAEFVTPASVYPHTFLVYTYGKQLLAPGQRIGYVAIPPDMPEREVLRPALFQTQVVGGWLFPNALLQHALPDLDKLCVDLKALQSRRDIMVGELKRFGYQLNSPEGTFYTMVEAPIEDDFEFTEKLAKDDVFVLPGTLVELPGHFRLSFTATDEMVEKALPVFEKAAS